MDFLYQAWSLYVVHFNGDILIDDLWVNSHWSLGARSRNPHATCYYMDGLDLITSHLLITYLIHNAIPSR